MITSKISGVNELKNKFRKIIKSLDGPMITVGYHEDAADPPDGEIKMASLAAVHEFGAEIKHPGGTDYGYVSKAAAAEGRSRFLKKGTGYAVIGQTEPHDIKIPARPSLEPGVNSGLKEYEKIMAKGVDDAVNNGTDIKKTMHKIGVIAVGKVKEYMTDLKTPPNTPGTIRRKKSDNPLIDEGHMRAAVDYKLETGDPEVGL